jgi:hypothetical protein
MKVKPAKPELKVRDPKSMEFIPADGSFEVRAGEHPTYWARRIQSGDVVVVDESPKKKV